MRAQREFFVLGLRSPVALRATPLPAIRHRPGTAVSREVADYVVKYAAAVIRTMELAGPYQVRRSQLGNNPPDALPRPAEPPGQVTLARPARASRVGMVRKCDEDGEHLAADVRIVEPSSDGID